MSVSERMDGNNLPSPCLGCGGYGREHKSFCKKQYDQVAESVREHAAKAERGLIHDEYKLNTYKANEHMLNEISILLDPYLQDNYNAVEALKCLLKDYEALKKKAEETKSVTCVPYAPTVKITWSSDTPINSTGNSTYTDKALVTNPPTTAMQTSTFDAGALTPFRVSPPPVSKSPKYNTWMVMPCATKFTVTNDTLASGEIAVYNVYGIMLVRYAAVQGQWSKNLPKGASYITSDCLSGNQITFSEA